MARNVFLKKSTFRQYLVERKDEFVGITRDDRACPIALYLALPTVSNRVWNVSALACVPQVDTDPGEDPDALRYEFCPPKWAREFIHNIDRHWGHEQRELTGEEALYVLEEY